MNIFKLARQINKIHPSRIFCYDIGVKINKETNEKRIHDIGFVRMDGMYDLYGKLDINSPSYRDELNSILEYFRHSSLYNLSESKSITMIAHNNFNFDQRYFTNALKLYNGKEYPRINHFDTLPLSRQLFPNEKYHSLKEISKRANIPYIKGDSLKDSMILSHVYKYLNDNCKH